MFNIRRFIMAITFQKVRVNSDWSIPSNVWADIKLATGMQSRNMGTAYGTQLYINLWEGMGDPDDYARLNVDNVNGDENIGFKYDFFSVPPVGANVYIISIQFGVAPLD